MNKGIGSAIFSLITILGLLLTACGGGAAPATEAPAAAPATQPPAAAPATQPPAAAPATAPAAAAAGQTTGESEAGARAAGLTFLADAYAGKYKGEKVTMTGPFADADAVKFANSMKPFEDATGITIQYEGSKQFEASITAQVQGGAPPDIVDFPQPGL